VRIWMDRTAATLWYSPAFIWNISEQMSLMIDCHEEFHDVRSM
jgi:hypothetical protein